MRKIHKVPIIHSKRLGRLFRIKEVKGGMDIYVESKLMARNLVKKT